MKNPRSRWPLVRQIREGADGKGLESMSEATRRLRARTEDARVARSICPYCGVGCGQLIYSRGEEIVAIEGDPESPISQGTLCPKGAASFELLTHDLRPTTVKYRAPGATEWTELDPHEAMDMVAQRVWESRRRTWTATTADLPEEEPGHTGSEEQAEPVRHTRAICHIGGATLDNEENYLIKKLFTAGLGMVGVSNQARI